MAKKSDRERMFPLRPMLFPIRPTTAPVARPGREMNRPSRADVLLQAIISTARKPETPATRGALRALVLKFKQECGVGF
jgi:hypothetical protein